MTRFQIKFKKRHLWHKPATVSVEGDSYFISSTDSEGYARLVIFSNDNGRKNHKLCANAHDVEYMALYPSI